MRASGGIRNIKKSMGTSGGVGGHHKRISGGTGDIKESMGISGGMETLGSPWGHHQVVVRTPGCPWGHQMALGDTVKGHQVVVGGYQGVSRDNRWH